jgi:hypothetical protein
MGVLALLEGLIIDLMNQDLAAFSKKASQWIIIISISRKKGPFTGLNSLRNFETIKLLTI